MKLHLPPIDVETANPNVIGEYLRELIFDCPEGKTGCYSCFNVVPMAVRIPLNEREDYWREDMSGGSLKILRVLNGNSRELWKVEKVGVSILTE